jgi:hypothetical protein
MRLSVRPLACGGAKCRTRLAMPASRFSVRGLSRSTISGVTPIARSSFRRVPERIAA